MALRRSGCIPQWGYFFTHFVGSFTSESFIVNDIKSLFERQIYTLCGDISLHIL